MKRSPTPKTGLRRGLLFLFLVLALPGLACQTIYRAFSPQPTYTILTATPSASDTPTAALPSATPAAGQPSPTPEAAPPSATPEAAQPSPTYVYPTYTPDPDLKEITQRMQLRVFDDLWQTVDENYLYPDFNGLDWDAMYDEYRSQIEAGIDTAKFYLLMEELIWRLGDEHSFFQSPNQIALEEAEEAGEYDYVGIGILASASQTRNGAVVLTVFPGSPAEGAGIRPRDAVLSVDGESVLNEDGSLKSIMRGPAGSTATFMVETPGQLPRPLIITRARIEGNLALPYEVRQTPAGQRIGYVFLFNFTNTTFDEQFEEALEAMSADGDLDGLIIDNRENMGGRADVMYPILANFTDGVVGNFTSRSREQPLRVRGQDVNGSQTYPIVILVGRGTASFGEIFSGALQDLGRAHIIGVVTDGNVETLWGFDLPDGSRIWIAAETFSPLNNPDVNWERDGIQPNEIVPGDWADFGAINDPAIQAALNYFDR